MQPLLFPVCLSHHEIDITGRLQRIAVDRLFALGETVLLAAFDAAVDPVSEMVVSHTKSVLARFTPSRRDDAGVDLPREDIRDNNCLALHEPTEDKTQDLTRLTQLPTLAQERMMDVVPAGGVKMNERQILADVAWIPEKHWAAQTVVSGCSQQEIPISAGSRAFTIPAQSNPESICRHVEEMSARNEAEVASARLEEQNCALVGGESRPEHRAPEAYDRLQEGKDCDQRSGNCPPPKRATRVFPDGQGNRATEHCRSRSSGRNGGPQKGATELC